MPLLAEDILLKNFASMVYVCPLREFPRYEHFLLKPVKLYALRVIAVMISL